MEASDSFFYSRVYIATQTALVSICEPRTAVVAKILQSPVCGGTQNNWWVGLIMNLVNSTIKFLSAIFCV